MSATPAAPLSVIIPTFNEEANIRRAIESVLGWANQIFVVDSYSTDRTVDVALEAGGDTVQIVQHEFANYSAQWNWALTHLPISQPWVMKLDADECATPEFRAEVSAALAEDDEDTRAFVVHWKLIFMGNWLRWGGLFPNGNVRIWRHGEARFENRDVNEHVVIAGRIRHIRDPIEHRDFKSLSHWIDRHNRYSSMEAKALLGGNVCGGLQPRLTGRPDERRMWLRTIYYRIPGRAFLYFGYRFVLRGGFLDGRAGFRFALLHAVFMYWIDLKRDEHRMTGALPEVTWPSRGRPHPAIARSPLQRLVDAGPRQSRPSEAAA